MNLTVIVRSYTSLRVPIAMKIRHSNDVVEALHIAKGAVAKDIVDRLEVACTRFVSDDFVSYKV